MTTRRMLFVCLGNICRSPLVEAVARAEFARAGIDAEFASAGTGDYHVGHAADPRTILSAAGRGYDLSAHRARQFAGADFENYDVILAMDRANLRDIEALCPAHRASRVGLFLAYAGIDDFDEVPDPYFGGAEGFERVIELARSGVKGLIARCANGA
ncbi:MAG: low molecular weight protein-tyrosine-phosphatase [Rudaea sp.]